MKKLSMKKHWHDQYITGVQVKELGEIPMR